MGLISRETRLVQSFDEKEPTMKEQWFLKMTEMNQELSKHLELGNVSKIFFKKRF